VADFENTHFTAASLVSAGDLEGAEFHNCRFEGVAAVTFAPFKKLRFFECRFELCDLSNWKLTGHIFREPIFENCKLVGINWAGASTLRDPSFNDCKMDLASFQGLDLRRLRATSSSLREADFASCQLMDADFSGSQLAGAVFTGARLDGADFRSAEEYFVDPAHTKVKGMKVRFPGAASLLVALGVRIES
jgi:fluoroquinolone resistance protein